MLQQANKYIYFFLIPIINLSASRRNRSRENRDASKNRLLFPPLVYIDLTSPWNKPPRTIETDIEQGGTEVSCFWPFLHFPVLRAQNWQPKTHTYPRFQRPGNHPPTGGPWGFKSNVFTHIWTGTTFKTFKVELPLFIHFSYFHHNKCAFRSFTPLSTVPTLL